MSPTSIRSWVPLRFSGGETIFCLVETRKGKKIFLPPKNFLLMRYKDDWGGIIE